tara:strand:- start:18644 stop:20020 length:1377 start_codon:yes stop_codon:yes gene_type:complete
MPNNLNPALRAFSDEPLLIDPTKADLVSSTLQHLSSDPEASALLNERQISAGSGDEFWGGDEHPFRPYTVHDGVLQIPVQGVLINRLSYQIGRWATGYRYIQAALERGMRDPDVRAIALIVDSPGGEVAGCFELVDKIYDAGGTKPIRAFASDHAFSAAYALASAAGEVVVSRSGGTGSIGVVTMHVDMSEALEQMGLKVTFIFAGNHKVDGNPYEKLPDEVKGRIQERIDRIYGVFTSTVARNRDMEEDAVRETEALTFDAEDSTARGLADRIGALDEEMVTFIQEVTEAEEEQMAITQEQLDKAVADARAEGHAEGLKAGKAEGETAGQTAERERAAAIMGSEEAKTRPAAARMMVDLGVPADKASEQLAKLPEEATAPKTGDDQGQGQGQQTQGQGQGQQTQGKSAFELAMENGNPDVGADANGQGSGTQEDPDAAVVNDIFGSVGYGPAPQRQN